MQQSQKYMLATSPSKNFRYRKVAVNGSTVTAFQSSPEKTDKIKPKQLMLEFPRKEKKNSEQEEAQVNIKALEEQYYRRYKADTGIKSLLKAYDQSKKRGEEQGMNKLGLQVIKIQSYPKQNMGKVFPGSSRQLRGSKKSLKKLQLKNIHKKEFLVPLKSNSARETKPISKEEDYQLKNFIDVISSLTNITREKSESSPSPETKLTVSHRRIFKKERRAEDYLYRRLQGSESKVSEQLNYIYDKRIKSYLEFLWKNMFAHNIYINLDLRQDDINNRPKKLKAYIAPGNNGSMIKGLIKRRFWWSLAQQNSNDCDFVWTQIKINQIFEKQLKTKERLAVLKDEEESIPRFNRTSSHLFSSKGKDTKENFNYKIMNDEDVQLYKQYKSRYQNSYKEREYSYKAEKVGKELQVYQLLAHSWTIHNHLLNNFYLGNKKALFYNLREYYTLLKQDVYNYLPLTFHIRKGVKDPEYHKFIDYYKKRAKQIQRESKIEEEEGVINKNKKRNIWIVKPGQNSNQGRGITVIDEIYELNSIIKQGERTNRGTTQNPNLNKEETQRTYIVQMYIDRPLLYNSRKFDIRHYMLITNMFGVMRGWWYEEGYVRTASYQFDIGNFEPEIHLTNDAVQKQYPDYQKYEPFNKISYEELQRYLDSNYSQKKYNFKQQILPQMKKMATDAAKSVYTKIAPNNPMHNFQIFGLDFMIDKNFKPWLIEINTNPSLDCYSPLLNRIIPYMVEQSLKLSLDLAYPPPTHYPNTAKHLAPLINLETFKYELIFDSQTEGEQLRNLYRRVKNNLIDQIGAIEDDEEFKDEGKECKLDDFV